MAQDLSQPQGGTTRHVTPSGLIIDTSGGKFTVLNPPQPPPTPQAQPANISPQVKSPESGGRSM
jgi:hypothetical protein